MTLSEINKEHINRIYQGLEYLTTRIAELQTEINELQKENEQ